MKSTLLLFFVTLCVYQATAQNVTYSYHFDGAYNEIYYKAPSLNAACASGTFTTETLPISISKKIHNFKKGCGLLYNDAIKSALAGSYTIEMYFRLDSISGYKKLIDFDSLSKDQGLYNQSGKLVLYPNFTSADTVISAGLFRYVAITRDASSKMMYINCNGKTAGTYTDNTGQYVLDANKVAIFFQDDKGTGGEQTQGSVAMIHISNYAMDSTTIKNNYTNLNVTLGVHDATASVSHNTVFPNPVTTTLNVVAVDNCNYTITDITGRIVSTGELTKGQNQLNIERMKPAIYFLKLSAKDDAWTEVQRFIRD